MQPKFFSTETQQNFTHPKPPKATATREAHLRHLLWQELYDEYVRHSEAKQWKEFKDTTTEYKEEFGKIPAVEDENAQQALRLKYPLYGPNAITLYNESGDIATSFKKRCGISRPIAEQFQQFG